MRALAVTLLDGLCVAQTYVGKVLPKRVTYTPADRTRRVLRDRAVQSAGSQTAGWWPASLLTITGPILIASLLLALFCGGGLWNCVPTWHDEGWYVNEMAVFATAGWEGGYTVIHEWPARAEWVRFGTHGPFIPALYGSLARAAGIRHWSLPMFNAGLLVLGSLTWVACCRVPTRQAWVAAFVAMTYWPLILYIPTSMQEVLHLSIAFVLAALTVLLARNSGNRWLLAVALCAVVIAAQLRVTWSLVAVPLMWIALRPTTARQWALLVLCGGTFVGAMYGEAIMLYSPYPNFMRDVLASASDSPLAACGLVVIHVLKNIVRYIAPNHDTFVQIAFRYQTLMIAGAAIYYLRKRRSREAATDSRSTPGERPARPDLAPAAFGFTLLNLVMIVGFVIAMYDVFDWRDYRVVAPHLLLALLVLIGCGARDWLGGYAVVSVLLVVLAVPQFATFHRPRVEFETSRIDEFAGQVATVIKFQPAALGWDNTLLMDIDLLESPLLMGLPRGIGISVSRYWDQQAWPPRSKYLLLHPDLARRLGIPKTMHRVAETELGDIYVRR